MHGETIGVSGERRKNVVEHLAIHPGGNVWQHADRLWWRWHLGDLARVCPGFVQCRLQLALVIGEHLFCFFDGDDSALHQGFEVQLANTAAFGDGLVHERLGVARVVAFVVAMTAITHHVDHHVLVELLAIVECELGDAHACLGVIAVHMEDRCSHRLGHIAAILRRMCELW